MIIIGKNIWKKKKEKEDKFYKMSSLRTFWFSLKQTLTYCWSFSSDYVSNLERWLANLNVFYLSIWSNTAKKKTSRIFLRNYRYNRPKSFKHWIYVLESPHCMFLQWIPKSEQIYYLDYCLCVRLLHGHVLYE